MNNLNLNLKYFVLYWFWQPDCRCWWYSNRRLSRQQVPCGGVRQWRQPPRRVWMSSCQGRGGQVCETGSLSVIFRCHDAAGSRLPVRVTWLLLRRITIMCWCLTPCTSLRAALIHLSFPTLVSASTLGNDSGFMYWNMPVFCKASNYFIPSDLNSDLQCKYYLFTKHFKIFYLYTYVIPYWGNFIFGQMGIWGLSCDGNETSFFCFLVHQSYSYQNRASCKIAIHPWAECSLPTHLNQKDL